MHTLCCRRRVSTIVVASLTLLGLAHVTIGLDVDPISDTRERQFQRVLVRQPVSGAGFLTTCIEAAPRVSSTDPNPDFCWTTFVFRPPDAESNTVHLYRYYTAAAPEHRCVCLATGSGLPCLVYIDDIALRPIDGVRWEWRKNAKWIHAVDGDHVREFSSPGVPHGQVTLDVGAFIAEVMGPEAPAASRDDRTHSIQLTKSNGSSIRMVFRSPNDATRFGSGLSQLFGRARNGTTCGIEGLIVDRASRGKQTMFNAERLPNVLRAQLATQPWTGELVGDPKDAVDTITRQRLLEELFPIRLRHPQEPEFVTRLYNQSSRIVAGVHHGATDVERRGEAILQIQLLAHELRLARSCIARELAPETGFSVVDDPPLIWHGFNVAIAPTATELYTIIAQEFLVPELLPLSTRADLCDAIGDLGPATGWSALLPLMGEDETFLRTVLHSRWQWEMPSEGVERCLAVLADADAGGTLETISVETLVRLNELPRIPAERVERWFRRQVARDVEPREWDAAAARLEACRVATLQPTGQQWLFDRIRQATDDADVRAVALAVLRQRAEATVALERWDFMPESLCRSILDLAGGQATACQR